MTDTWKTFLPPFPPRLAGRTEGTAPNPCLSEWMFNQGLISETPALAVAGALYPHGSPEQEKQNQMRGERRPSPLFLWLWLELFICFLPPQPIHLINAVHLSRFLLFSVSALFRACRKAKLFLLSFIFSFILDFTRTVLWLYDELNIMDGFAYAEGT